MLTLGTNDDRKRPYLSSDLPNDARTPWGGSDEPVKRRLIRFRNYTPSDPTLVGSTSTSASATCSTPSSTIAKNTLQLSSERGSKATTTASKANVINGPSSSTSATKKASKSVLQLALENARAELVATVPSRPSSTTNKIGGSLNGSIVFPFSNSSISKRINADLKRGIQSKLEKLEKRTQRALLELLKQRLDQEAAATATHDARYSNGSGNFSKHDID